MTLPLARRLLRHRTIPAAVVESCLLEACRTRRSFLRLLFEAELGLYRAQLQAILESSEVPSIAAVRVVPELLAQLPVGLSDRFLAVPVRRDLRMGTIDLAVVDPFDVHTPAEVAFHLGANLRVLRAPYDAIVAALDDSSKGSTAPSAHRTGEAPSKVAPSEPPITARGLPPAPLSSEFEGPISEQPIPLVRRSMPPAPSAPEKPIQTEPLAVVRNARTLPAVIDALCDGANALGCEIVVFALKNQAFRAQRSSIQGSLLESLEVPAHEPSILSAAQERDFYFGAIPDTPIHAGIRAALGFAALSEVYAVPVRVGQRSVLMVLLAGFNQAYSVTRRADALAKAAGRALTDIVRASRS